MDYKIVHNGYKIVYVNSTQKVEQYIDDVINTYKHLNPKKILDRTLKSGSRKIRIVRYQYNTLYEEDFIIECW